VASASTKPSLPVSSPQQAPRVEALATEAAVRLISETAHDLRSPLTAVRESMRLVRDGDLGPINLDQHDCLNLAIEQCGCIEQMVGEMVQLERLRGGTPRVQRQWVSVSEIRRMVDETVQRWASPRNVNVLWDGADEPAMAVYADPIMLRRLLVNLATNAIRASVEGAFVLIRLAPLRRGETICWSVIDRGRGISENQMRCVGDREVSFAGGEGLGLAISRQLAASMFSFLKIRSRLGKGTEVSFETAASGPRSVASHWSRWRCAFQSADQKMVSRDECLVELNRAAPNQIRFDSPSISVSLAHDGARPRCEDGFTAGVVSVGGTVSKEAADRFDAVFQSHLALFELAYRVDDRRWIWCLDADEPAIADRMATLTESINAAIPGIRLKWSAPHTITLDPRRTSRWMNDLLVRQSLVGDVIPTRFDSDEVRLGASPMVSSSIAADRLDAELARLTSTFRSQSRQLQIQAKNLRPNE
jgi:hypothetical protein